MDAAIRPYREEDAAAVSALIARALREVNARDYPPDEIERLAARHTPQAVAGMAREPGAMFVADEEGEPVGVLRCVPSRDEENVWWLRTVFVRPDRMGRGVGRLLAAAGEEAARGRKASLLRLGASRTSHGFYARLGFCYDAPGPGEDGLYRMSKRL